MGPLAVRPDRQGAGLGRQVVLAGIAWLRENGATTIGLETMPRTVENIGFYSQLGFLPGHLTVSLTRSPDTGSATVCTRISRDPAGATALTACEDLLDAVMPGVSFRREFRLTADLALGDATLYRREGALAAFALWHAAPLAQGRPREDLRVLKLVAADVDAMLKVLSGVGAAAEEEGTERVTVRCQTRQATAYAALIAGGWQAHWTDLRMSLTGREERAPVGVCFSNWEI